jgi:hypothetical protein
MQLCADPLTLPHDLLSLPPGPRLALTNQCLATPRRAFALGPRDGINCSRLIAAAVRVPVLECKHISIRRPAPGGLSGIKISTRLTDYSFLSNERLYGGK